MADVFGEAKRQREGQKLERIWFVSGISRTTTLHVQHSFLYSSPECYLNSERARGTGK